MKSELLDEIPFLVPLSTIHATWAGSGSKPRPSSREAINVTLTWPWSYLWEIGCERGAWNDIPQDWIQWHLTWTLDYITREFGWHVLGNVYTNLVKCTSRALIFQSKSCNVGPETAHFSCSNAFCMSPCRTARHSMIISWWSVSSSGTLAVIWKYSFRN
jgi:hypothetical protein